MGVVDLSEVRRKVASAIAGQLEADGWRESDDPCDIFGAAGDGEGRGHQSYAVGTPKTVALKDRQRRDKGVLSDTTVRVRWAYNLSALDQLASYDDALDAARRLRAAVMSVQQDEDFGLIYVSSDQAADAQGWMLGEQTYRAIHHLPLY